MNSNTVMNSFQGAKVTHPTASPLIVTCRGAGILGRSPLADHVADPLEVSDAVVSVDVAVA